VTAVELSIVIPAYNEALRLPSALLSTVDYLDRTGREYEIIVVDDGSTDHTAEMVEKFAKLRPKVRVMRLERNCGKGCAVRTGMLQGVGSYILFADADGATPIEEIERLYNVVKGGIDVAIGSRALRSKETTVKTHWHRKFLGQSFNRVVNYLVLPGIRDTQCGFKMFQRRAARFLFGKQRVNGFSFDVEILFLAQKTGMKIVEVPVNWSNIPGSKVNLVLDAARMFRDVLTFKLRHRRVTPKEFQQFVV